MEDEAEYLLIASETSDPYATMLINPKTGVSKWSYRGNELQGSVTGSVEMLGSNSIFVAIKEKPLLHLLSMDNSKCFHVKSVLPKSVRHLAVTPDGSALFAAINNQIYIWIIATGELIAVINCHHRSISSFLLNSDGSLLVSGAEDGSLCVFVVAELMSANSVLEHAIPFRHWRPHSLSVSSIAVTRHNNARILSCSKDHTATLHSVTANICLLKISCDMALSSCAIDPAECRLFLGTVDGSLVQLDLYSLNKTEVALIIAETAGNFPLFKGHSAELAWLDVNHDGSLLVSGDVCGVYVIWDVSSRQCLKTSSLKGPICKLKFNTRWKAMERSDKKKQTLPIPNLKRQKEKKLPAFVLLQNGMLSEEVRCFQHISLAAKDEFYTANLDTIISDYAQGRIQANASTGDELNSEYITENLISKERVESSDSKTIESLKSKIATLEKANQQIYNFAASLIIDRS